LKLVEAISQTSLEKSRRKSSAVNGDINAAIRTIAIIKNQSGNQLSGFFPSKGCAMVGIGFSAFSFPDPFVDGIGIIPDKH
jgi:hypothetical protein